MKESTFEGVGGLKIFTRSWQPEGKTRGVVVIVPGFNSHSGQYLLVGEQFAAKDLAAYAVDLRGRGRSEGERYYVEQMEDYTDDVATLIRTAKSENVPITRRWSIEWTRRSEGLLNNLRPWVFSMIRSFSSFRTTAPMQR